jgi:kynurenine 3-monooxygenase
MSQNQVTVLGAGLVGSLISIYLANRGFKIRLFEKRPDMRNQHIDGGRSINLALSNRGLAALEKVGLLSQVKEICLPMHGRIMHGLDCSITYQPYGKEGQHINSISRSKLNTLLMNAAESAGVELYFEETCIDANLPEGICHLNGPGGRHQVNSDFILGADGAFSGLREAMRITDRFNFSQYYLPHGYKELTMPATASGDFALDPKGLHIWPREQYMLIALPNLDRSFTCTLFLPFEGKVSFSSINESTELLAFFESAFPDAVPLLPELINEFDQNPTGSLVTIRCSPWMVGKSGLIGDASHAIVPFYGQGMNAGFEDCRLLDQLLSKHKDDLLPAFAEFQTSRMVDTDAIADLAFQNFIEMRDLVADQEFLLRKEIEMKLHDLYPDVWIPLYSRVTFSDQPYSEAQRIGHIQRSIMDKVMEIPGIEDKWESLDFSAFIKDLKAQVD